MKKRLLLLIVVLGTSLNAQTIHYNIQSGYVAEGYDVVSYFDNSAKEGDKNYEATHEGVKYKFSSQENLDTFNENPTKYVPQYGGYCAYALGAKGKKVSIDPETFEVREGKLYLFYNSWGNNTFESWLEGPPNVLRAKADENWKKLTE